MTVKKTSTGNRTTKGARLPDSQLGRIMRLLDDVDSVELKLTLPADSHRAAIKGLPIDPVEAEPRQVFFFDTPTLDLNRAGVVVRARRIRGGTADTVIKLRPVVPADLPASLRRSPSFKVELDALPGGFVCSASFKGRCTGEQVNAVVHGEMPARKLFSKEQREFFRKNAPAGLDFDALVPLGPTFLLKCEFRVKKLDLKIGAEYWLYPDGSRILELSTKAAPAEALKVAAEFRGYLERRGVETSGLQETKTASALDFFSAQLRHAADGKK